LFVDSAKCLHTAPSASGQGHQTAKPGRRRRAAESTNKPLQVERLAPQGGGRVPDASVSDGPTPLGLVSVVTNHTAPSASGQGHQTAKPGRRRRAAESTNKPPKNQHFYFVDQNSSSKEKRAHVMRHHVQEKRKLCLSIRRRAVAFRVWQFDGLGQRQMVLYVNI
jgi:hypothetical protein